MISKARVLELLKRMDLKMQNEGIHGEIGLMGGTAMMFSFNARESTHDVDVVLEADRPNLVMALSHELAQEEGLALGWLNDAVTAFLPEKAPEQRVLLSLPNLLVWYPDASYLLAMKVLASRPTDEGDLKILIKSLGLTDPLQVFELVKKYYPKRKAISKRSEDLVIGVFEELE
jgi:hypothetical protein